MDAYIPTVRLLEVFDASAYLEFLCLLDTQSPYMHYRAGERVMTEQGLRSRIKKQAKQGNSFVVLAIGIDDKPIGYLSVNGGNSKATAHSGTVAVGVLSQYRRLHIADMLMKYALAEMYSCNMFRLECTVVERNEAAIAFYRAWKFSLVGRFRKRYSFHGFMLSELIYELMV